MANRSEEIAKAQSNAYRDVIRSDFAELEQEPASGPAWLPPLRKGAHARFAALGFPTPHDEEWRFTNVGVIAKASLRLARRGAAGAPSRSRADALAFAGTPGPRIVLVNGYFAPELSTLPAMPNGVRVESLAALLVSQPEAVEPHLARHASYERNPFVALNTAFLRDGAVVLVSRKTIVAEPITIVHLATSSADALAAHPRSLVLVEDEAQATIVECYAGVGSDLYLTNAVTEIVVGNGASAEHYKIQHESEDAYHVATMVVQLGRASTFTSQSIGFGGALVRNDITAVLAGEGSECTLNGLYLASGSQHVDNHTTIDHAKAHCASHELYKGVLAGSARGVFNGKILVRPDAQKTDAKQTNKNLLLSEDAMINTKPQLEIYADDVKCTHGATIGRLDENQIFYMRSRGIPEAEAMRLLTYAFAADIVDRVKPATVRTQLEAILVERLRREGA